MKPYSDEEAARRLMYWGTLFTLTRYVNGKIEYFILDNEEVTIKELQNDKPELR